MRTILVALLFMASVTAQATVLECKSEDSTPKGLGELTLVVTAKNGLIINVEVPKNKSWFFETSTTTRPNLDPNKEDTYEIGLHGETLNGTQTLEATKNDQGEIKKLQLKFISLGGGPYVSDLECQ